MLAACRECRSAVLLVVLCSPMASFLSTIILPIAVGAGVRYDKAGPVQLLGGLGFALLPNTASGAGTPVGLRIMGTGPYKITSFPSSTAATVERFDGYWGPKPRVKTCTFSCISNTQTLQLAVLRLTKFCS